MSDGIMKVLALVSSIHCGASCSMLIVPLGADFTMARQRMLLIQHLMILFIGSILIVSCLKKNNPDSLAEDDNSTIAITSALPSAKNEDFNGFTGSEKRSPSGGENDLFTMDSNSERKIINVFLSVIKSPSARKSREKHGKVLVWENIEEIMKTLSHSLTHSFLFHFSFLCRPKDPFSNVCSTVSDLLQPAPSTISKGIIPRLLYIYYSFSLGDCGWLQRLLSSTLKQSMNSFESCLTFRLRILSFEQFSNF